MQRLHHSRGGPWRVQQRQPEGFGAVCMLMNLSKYDPISVLVCSRGTKTILMIIPLIPSTVCPGPSSFPIFHRPSPPSSIPPSSPRDSPLPSSVRTGLEQCIVYCTSLQPISPPIWRMPTPVLPPLFPHSHEQLYPRTCAAKRAIPLTLVPAIYRRPTDEYSLVARVLFSLIVPTFVISQIIL